MFLVEDTTFNKQKYAGRCRAIVTSTLDPELRGRITVDHPLFGPTNWIPYLQIPGLFSVPQVGDVVYVEADCGYGEYLVAWGNFLKGDSSADNLPTEFSRNNPTNMGFYSPGGHLVEIDDGSGVADVGQGIRITTSGGNKITILEDETAPEGLITIETTGGANITIDGTEDTINASSSFGDSLTVSAADGILATTPAAGGTSLSMKNGQVTINGAIGVKVADGVGAELNLTGGKVALGGTPAELLDLFDQALSQLITLTNTLSVEAPAGFGTILVGAPTYLSVNGQLTTIKGLLDGIKGSL